MSSADCAKLKTTKNTAPKSRLLKAKLFISLQRYYAYCAFIYCLAIIAAHI